MNRSGKNASFMPIFNRHQHARDAMFTSAEATHRRTKPFQQRASEKVRLPSKDGGGSHSEAAPIDGGDIDKAQGGTLLSGRRRPGT